MIYQRLKKHIESETKRHTPGWISWEEFVGNGVFVQEDTYKKRKSKIKEILSYTKSFLHKEIIKYKLNFKHIYITKKDKKTRYFYRVHRFTRKNPYELR